MLYPDHVIFLGPGVTELASDPDTAATIDDAAARGSKLFAVPSAGVLLSTDTMHSADELALCLALVLERVPEDARLTYLTTGDETELLDWDAEKYRQSLAHARAV